MPFSTTARETPNSPMRVLKSYLIERENGEKVVSSANTAPPGF
jgi:hypothetical protein